MDYLVSKRQKYREKGERNGALPIRPRWPRAGLAKGSTQTPSWPPRWVTAAQALGPCAGTEAGSWIANRIAGTQIGTAAGVFMCYPTVPIPDQMISWAFSACRLTGWTYPTKYFYTAYKKTLKTYSYSQMIVFLNVNTGIPTWDTVILTSSTAWHLC